MLTRSQFHSRFGHPAIIGMVHLLPLPGSARWAGAIGDVIERAIEDAEALRDGGVHAMLFENFGDTPFLKTVEAETVAAMTSVICSVGREVDLPFGVNVLRNDPLSALAISAATGAAFIRVNVHTGAMATDQGIIEGAAGHSLRNRRRLGRENVAIFADHRVKHATPVGEFDPVQAVKDLRYRGMADAILVTGSETGAPVDEEEIERLRDVLDDTPIVAASGVSAANAGEISRLVDGVIVGSSLKRDGKVDQPVDLERVRALVGAFGEAN